MDDLLRIVVQWLHVTGGVLWIGGGTYTVFVQLPAIGAMPAPARGAALAQLAPRQLRYLLRVAEATIALGVVNLVLTGRAQQLSQPFGSRWAVAILLGIVFALILYGIVRGVVEPLANRLLATLPVAAGGDAAAGARVAAMAARLRRLGFLQIAIGIAVILLMVMARFS